MSLYGKGSTDTYQVNGLILYVQNVTLVMRSWAQETSRHCLDRQLGLSFDRDVDQSDLMSLPRGRIYDVMTILYQVNLKVIVLKTRH